MDNKKTLADIQKEFMNNDALDASRKEIHESWFNEKTVDFWRHKRMYLTLSALAKEFQHASWLTIGDGRFGLDSIRLKKLFDLTKILPTDIAENMLMESKSRGFIENFGVENAEQLSFQDNSFDVIFCKESFHHFPKPFMSLYEMIRVCREAVVLVEPAEKIYTNDVSSKKYLLSALKLFWAKLTGKKYLPYLPSKYFVEHGYEEAGNYIYTLSVRELERLMHGMDIAALAYKKFNDIYIKGCEFEEAVAGNPMYQQMQAGLKANDDLVKKMPQYYQPNMITTILFKNKISNSLRDNLIADGFQFVPKLPNPYR